MTRETLKKKLLDTGAFLDNSYIDQYVDLIILNSGRPKEKFKTQNHHIIPKCYYKINNLPVDDNKENRVHLLHSDHVLAHYFICLCALNEEFRFFNELSVLKALNFKYFKVSEDYDQQARFLESLDEYQNIKEECLRLHGQRLKGKKRPPKLVEQIGQKLKLVPHTDEWNKKVSEAGKGRVAINKDNQCKYVKESELQQYINDGWVRGGVKHVKTDKSKLITINKDGKVKRVAPDQLEEFMQNGWDIGGKKGAIPWNKGLSKDNDERLALAAQSMTGHKWSDEQRSRRCKEGNPMYGKHHSAESINKGMLTKKKNGTITPSEETKQKISNTLKGYVVVENSSGQVRHIRPEQLKEFERQGYHKKGGSLIVPPQSVSTTI